eukprot:6626559-Pyramimonas_sp.AAC.1
MEASRAFGRLTWAAWERFGPSFRILGAPAGPPGAPEAPWNARGSASGHLLVIFRVSWGPLGQWALLGASLGVSWAKRREFWVRRPRLGRRFGAFLGGLGASWAVLTPSWAVFGPS